MQTTVDRVIRDIRESHRAPFALIQEAAQQEDTAFLIDLAAWLERPERIVAIPQAVLQSTFDHIERALALTPSRACTEAALIVLQMRRKHSVIAGEERYDHRVRRTASMLAHGQKMMTLVDLLLTHQDPAAPTAAIIDPLVHEMIIRGMVHDALFAHVMRQYEARHPLGVLPPERMEIEAQVEAALPDYAYQGSSHHGLPLGGGGVEPGQYVFTVRQTTTEGGMQRLTRAVQGMLDASNADGVAHTFSVSPRIPPHEAAYAALLRTLNIGVTEGGATLTAPQVFRTLFGAASQGGAYGGGVFGAYGRLRAWESLAGLVGLQAPSSVDDIQQVAFGARWATFSCDWFARVAWDFGLLCVRPGGDTCAVLAITDED